MMLPVPSRSIEGVCTDVWRPSADVAPFFSACALGLVAPLLLFGNSFDHMVRIGGLIACFFAGRLIGQSAARQLIRKFTSGKLEILSHLIAAIGYAGMAVTPLGGGIGWTSLSIWTFIVGTSSAMTIATNVTGNESMDEFQTLIVTGLGFGSGWVLAGGVLALHAGDARPAPLSVVHWVAMVSAVLELSGLVPIRNQSSGNPPIARRVGTRKHLGFSTHLAVLGCAMACTSVAFLAGESAHMVPAMLSALIGCLALIIVVVMKWACGRTSQWVARIGLALVAAGTAGSVGVYYTSSRLLWVAAAIVIAIGAGIYCSGASAGRSPRTNSVAWIIGPLIASAMYYPHLRTAVLLPALVVAVATGIQCAQPRNLKLLVKT